MKNIFKLIIAIALLNATYSYAAPEEFIITVKSNNAGSSLNTQFTIPTFGVGYNYNVDCNSDGTFEGTALTGDYTCDFIPFGGAGTYQIAIIGNLAGFEGFPRIYFNNTGDRLKVLNIDRWGINPWKNMRAAFRGASNMTVTATDVPNLSQVGDMRLMFSSANMANPDTSMWNTSNVTNMAAMFQNASTATPDVSNWDVSMVSNMGFLFAGATNANPNLSQWDFNNATDMTTMLGGSGISTINYDAFLINVDKNTNLVGINLNNVQVAHCSIQAQVAFNNLTTVDGWTINENGFVCTAANPANDFVIVVDTTIVGSTSNTQFEINTNNANGEIYNYNVDCDSVNAGANIATGQTGNYICTYTNPGTYTISISDNIGDKTGFPRIDSLFFDDAKKIVDIEQWGTGIWTSMKYAFRGASNMIVSAIDIPDLSLVVNMKSMFSRAGLANPITTNWNTTNVENMSTMFLLTAAANPNTSNWNTSMVTTMAAMFSGATAANPDTSNWDTAMVTDMQAMFKGATAANPNTSNWNTAKVTRMKSMFKDTILANPDTSNWNTAMVTSVNSMFDGATAANPNTSNWNTAKVSNMRYMFRDAILANPDTSNWNTAMVTNMRAMFAGAISANPDVSNWDITSIIPDLFNNMNSMFLGVTLPIASYDSLLTHFNSQAVQSGVTFHGGNSKYCNVAAHDNLTSTTTGHSWTISDDGLDPNCPDPLDDFVIEVDTTIIGSTSNTEFEINTNTSNGEVYNYNVDCDGANAFTNTTTAQTGNYTCNYATPGVYTIRISDNADDRTGFPRLYSFLHNDARKIVGLKQWGTGIWSSMEAAFADASSMIVSAVDTPDLSQVNSMLAMFSGASLANPNTSGWNTTNVTNMSTMFGSTDLANPDTSNWNTANVMDMSFMFSSATAANPDTSGWNTVKVKDMTGMFSGATMANPDTSGWNTAMVTNMSYMFSLASLANPDTSGWNTAKVTDMSFMFRFATSANPDVSNWDMTMVSDIKEMFVDVIMPTSVYDAILGNFNLNNPQMGLSFSGGNSKYCNVTAHDNLTNAITGHGWIITDGGLDPNCSEIIFENSFEDVIVFKAAEKQFVYDFSAVSLNLDPNPLLIARGVDTQNNTVIKIYLRKDVGQLQIRKDTLKLDESYLNQWNEGQWQNSDNDNLTVIQWQ